MSIKELLSANNDVDLNGAVPKAFDMRKEEAFLIGKFVRSLEFEECINLGSGDIDRLLQHKPWMDAEIFAPLRAKGVRITHSDFEPFSGVNISVDLTNRESVATLVSTESRKCVLICNVLEHVPSQQRQTIISNVEQALSAGDYLVISVPHKYPYHADPIDTMYRPHIDDLEAELTTSCIMKTEVISNNYLQEIRQMPFDKCCRKLLKPLWPLQRPSKYRESISRLSYLFRNYRVSVVATIKK